MNYYLKPHTVSVLICIFVLTLISCSSAQKNTSHFEVKSESRPSVLNQQEAEIRSQQVSRINYVMWFGLDPDHNDFEGRTQIRFELNPKASSLSKELFIDFKDAKIKSFIINRVAQTPEWIKSHYNQYRVTLAISELNIGINRIDVVYTQPFSSQGIGMHKFKDTTDQSSYVYTDFEPYNAHHVFPCFDQPDLKATYELTVEAPENWQVISNVEEREVAVVDGRRSWQFPTTSIFSTYLFALHAGPYAVWEDQYDGIPIRLFARESLAKYVDHKEWLDITKKGLQFYHKAFGMRYPFIKYDQILVPDYNQGAMENVAAVTFSERMIFRSKTTLERHRGRANTILHEMAHMWFGDLVTMKWWDDLWLNESFATFMATLALDQTRLYPDIWEDFAIQEKGWAYWTDQLVTTHPIVGIVSDTDQAKASFDGITYGKGASVLKQLYYYLGEEGFLKGIQAYFKKHAYQNTTLNDFIGALGKAVNKDLDNWNSLWLKTSSLNSILTDWSCKDGKIDHFIIKQSGQPLRPHRTQISLYNQSLKKPTIIPVTYEVAETPVNEAIGKPCPVFVFPNQQDYDYVKVVLDPVSLETAKARLSQFGDSFSRGMLWSVLWEMVHDSLWPARSFMDTVVQHLPKEKKTSQISDALGAITSRRIGTSALSYLPETLREPAWNQMETFLKTQLMKAAPGSDSQLIYFQNFLNLVKNPESQEWLLHLLEGKKSIPGLKMEQERRWEIIRSLSMAGHSEAKKLAEDEYKKDATDMGKKSYLSAVAALPTAENKTALKQKFAHPTKDTKLADARAEMRNFYLVGQESFTEDWAKTFFDAIPELVELGKGDDNYAKAFTSSLFPTSCNPGISERTDQYIQEHPQLPFTIIKELKIASQENRRCFLARELSLKSLQKPDNGQIP